MQLTQRTTPAVSIASLREVLGTDSRIVDGMQVPRRSFGANADYSDRIRVATGTFDDAVRAAQLLSRELPSYNDYGDTYGIGLVQGHDGTRWLVPLDMAFTCDDVFPFHPGYSQTTTRVSSALEAVVGARGPAVDLRTVTSVTRGG